MPRKDIILWLDLETSGSDLADHVILEVGCAMTDSSPELNVLGTFSTIVAWPPEDALDALPYPLSKMDEVVIQMHTNNGLLSDLMDDFVAPDINEAGKMLVRWLRDNDWSNGEHIPLAGSGVSHFDRNFIRRDWPRFDRMLSYWAYDVGVIRRSLRLAGIELPEGDQSTKTHRALDDALQHAEEMRQYLRLFSQLGSKTDEPVSGIGEGVPQEVRKHGGALASA